MHLVFAFGSTSCLMSARLEMLDPDWMNNARFLGVEHFDITNYICSSREEKILWLPRVPRDYLIKYLGYYEDLSPIITRKITVTKRGRAPHLWRRSTYFVWLNLLKSLPRTRGCENI
jgi:hypothetical protein